LCGARDIRHTRCKRPVVASGSKNAFQRGELMDLFDGIDGYQEFLDSKLDDIFDFLDSHDAICPD
jgi:hypothetical protein